jgi:hypothetical protein
VNSIDWIEKELGFKDSGLIAFDKKTNRIYILSEDAYNYILSEYQKEKHNLGFALMFDVPIRKSNQLFDIFLKVLELKENFYTRLNFYNNKNNYNTIYLILEI